MSGNPEFRRNLWIQFSSTRVLVGSLLTGLLLVCALALDMALTAQTKFVPTVTTYTARWLAMVILVFWAGYQAAGAVVVEIRRRTWDPQRLSTLHPWTMAWGKLFGSTSLPWLMALISAAAYAASEVYIVNAVPELNREPRPNVFISLGAIFGYGIACQATGMLASLARVSGRPGARGSGTMVPYVVSLLALGLLALFANWALENEGSWYGLRLGEQALRLVTIWFVALWAIIGVYRRMRRELQMRTVPWAWLLFLIALAVYGEGLAYGRREPQGALLLPTAILMVMLWAITLIEAKDPLTLRQCFAALRRGEWRTGATLVPLWLVTYIVFTATIAISIAIAVGSPDLRTSRIPGALDADTLLVLIAAFLYLTRDVLLVQTLTLGREGYMAGVAGGGILFVYYFAVPAVFIAGKQSDLLGLVLPTGQGGWMMCLLPVALETIACIVLFAWRWRVFWRVNAAKAPAA